MFEVGHDIFKNGFSVHGTVDSSAHARLRFVYGFFCFWFIVFIIYTLILGFKGIDKTRRPMASGIWNVSRADIVDRNGDILAKNVLTGHVTLRPQDIKSKDKEAVARLIYQVFPDKYSLADALKIVNSDSKYIKLKSYASDLEREKILNARLSGLKIETDQTRKYPKGRLFSHVVGMASGNKLDGFRGLEGAERVYNDYLNENTDPLRLSLDSRIQTVFYDQLSIAMDKYRAKAAMGMLMDSRTGEMLAMVSLPDFDPSNINADPKANRKFKLLRDAYEMGSVFKAFNTAMAMENGINKEYYVKEPYKIKNSTGRIVGTIKDMSSFRPPRPYLTVEEIMLHSCNVGSAQIALDLPDGTQQEFFHRLHFDKPLNLDFGRTEHSMMPQKWGPVERATISYGHGIAVTPMHLLLGINAITNGGIYIMPTLRKRTVGVVNGERVLSSDISERVRGVMFRIAEETTGRFARVAGVKIGGKTGTAEKYNNKGSNLTVFAGAFPIDAPRYTILVILDEPKGTTESGGWKTASWNAVPTAGKILDSIMPLLFE